jgi:predicted  nucleic acid-binding Zn-ribbon protein
MGDSAEGLVDAQARIQDRLDELEQARMLSRRVVKDPTLEQRLQSLRLARTDLQRQVDAGAHPRRREQLSQAVAELDRRIAELTD